MDAGDPAHREFGRGRVERPVPRPAGNRNPTGSQAVDCGEREAFRLPVIPAEPAKEAGVLGQLLFHVQSESVFQCSVAACVRNLWSPATRFRLPDRIGTDRLGIAARVGVIPVVQNPDCAGVLH